MKASACGRTRICDRCAPAPCPRKRQARFLPAADYARTKPVDYAKMAAAQRAFSERYAKEVRKLRFCNCARPTR